MRQHYSPSTALAFMLLLGLSQLQAEAPESFPEKISFEQISQRLLSAIGTLDDQIKSHPAYRETLGKQEYEYQTSAIGQAFTSAHTILGSKIHYSGQFLDTLDYDRQAFDAYSENIGKAISRVEKGLTPMPVTLNTTNRFFDAVHDLYIKANFVSNSDTDQVQVTVNTLDANDGTPVPHCFVWYVPCVKDDAEHTLKFDKESTPTTQTIPAAKYYIWAEKGSKKGERTPFLCGTDNSKTRTISIPAPQ